MSNGTATIKLRSIDVRNMQFVIASSSPIVMHKWATKAVTMIEEKQAGKKTRDRDARNPEAETEAAMHRTIDGKPGIPAGALKKAIIGAAHKDIGIEKTIVRKAIFVNCDDPNGVIPFTTCSDPVMRQDMVRVGRGSADIRYRPMFSNWTAVISLDVDPEWLQDDDVLALMDRAGFGVGLLEMRPEKGGDLGRFRVDRNAKIVVSDRQEIN